MNDSLGSTKPVKNPSTEETKAVRASRSGQTAPAGNPPAASPASEPSKPQLRFQKFTWIGLLRALGIFLLGVVILLAMAFVGGWFGVQSGMELRFQAKDTLVAGQGAEQYALAMQDMEKGNYSVAATRVAFIASGDHAYIPPAEVARLYQMGLDDMNAERYDRAEGYFNLVILLDPNFAQAKDSLAELWLLRSRTATPTLQFTPTVTPTLDLRGEEELFNQIRSLINAKDWDNAIQAINSLRNKNFTYRAVEVDGMYYTALRNRGVNRILVAGDPEGGIYDLTLAERIGPLDRDADSYRTWARYYITGSSFWEADWEKVVYYFEMIYTALPNLRDGSGMTAVERFRIGALHYADQLAAAGDYCKAEEYYGKSLSLNSDPAVQPTRDYAWNQCQQQNVTPQEPVPTSQGGGETPTPTLEVTATPTPTPTDTPPAP